MRSALRFVQAGSTAASPAPPEPLDVDSDAVVILAALLCALICVVGLALVARCAWLRRHVVAGASPPAAANKGLKKKALHALPKMSYDESSAASATGGMALADCAICLVEFVKGDEIRVLPQCGHGFHVGCVDTWLMSHSSCPSCRRVLVVGGNAAASRCLRCGSSSAASAESGAKAGEDDGGASGFLP